MHRLGASFAAVSDAAPARRLVCSIARGRRLIAEGWPARNSIAKRVPETTLLPPETFAFSSVPPGRMIPVGPQTVTKQLPLMTTNDH